MTTIITGTPKTEVFVNELGGICIKQYNELDEESWVYFTIEEADRIIQAIKDTKKEAELIREQKGEKDGN